MFGFWASGCSYACSALLKIEASISHIQVEVELPSEIKGTAPPIGFSGFPREGARATSNMFQRANSSARVAKPSGCSEEAPHSVQSNLSRGSSKLSRTSSPSNVSHSTFKLMSDMGAAMQTAAQERRGSTRERSDVADLEKQLVLCQQFMFKHGC